MTEVKKLVKEFFNEETLPEERLNSILNQREQIGYIRSKKIFWYASAASVLIICFFTGLSVYKNHTISTRILHEFASNHLRKLDVEVKANNYNELSRLMHKIHFPIRPPGRTFGALLYFARSTL